MKRIVKSIFMASSCLLLTHAVSYASTPDKLLLGIWKGSSSESCQAVKNQSAEDFMIIGNKKIERYEGTCSISEITNRDNEFYIKGLCESEGETSRYIKHVELIDQNHIVVDGRYKYERCE